MFYVDSLRFRTNGVKRKSKDLYTHLINSSVAFFFLNAELRLAFESVVFFGNPGFVSYLALGHHELLNRRYIVLCVCLHVFKAFAKLDFFCMNLTGGFVESFPDRICHYCKSFTPLIFVGRGSEWTAYED